jgi:sortase A
MAAAAPRTAPIEPPANPLAAVPVVKIGEIQIPKIGLVHPLYEGVTLTVIDHGPGHWPGSAVPGQLGNAVFAGHRVTHTHPFLRINELVPGDDIIFKMDNGTFTYKVTGHQIVTPRDVHIVDPTPDATLTLFACHPPHQAIQRYVVRASFVSSTPV